MAPGRQYETILQDHKIGREYRHKRSPESKLVAHLILQLRDRTRYRITSLNDFQANNYTFEQFRSIPQRHSLSKSIKNRYCGQLYRRFFSIFKACLSFSQV